MVKKIKLVPYKAHRHLGRGTGDEEFVQYSYKGIALNKIEQRLALGFNKLVSEWRQRED